MLVVIMVHTVVRKAYCQQDVLSTFLCFPQRLSANGAAMLVMFDAFNADDADAILIANWPIACSRWPERRHALSCRPQSCGERLLTSYRVVAGVGCWSADAGAEGPSARCACKYSGVSD